jgi:hypothetical protein
MDSQTRTAEFLERLPNVASRLQRKLRWLIGTGLAASAVLAWLAFDIDSATGWNAVKCGLIMLPSLVWVLIWSILGQLKEAPKLAGALASRDDSLFQNIQKSGFSDSVNVRSIFSTLRAFRQEEGLGVVVDTIGNVTLLANPLFAIFAFIMMTIMIIFIVISPIILLF